MISPHFTAKNLSLLDNCPSAEKSTAGRYGAASPPAAAMLASPLPPLMLAHPLEAWHELDDGGKPLLEFIESMPVQGACHLPSPGYLATSRGVAPVHSPGRLFSLGTPHLATMRTLLARRLLLLLPYAHLQRRVGVAAIRPCRHGWRMAGERRPGGL